MDYLWKATGELLIKVAQMQPDRISEGTLKHSILSELGHEFGFPISCPKILSQIPETCMSKLKLITLHKVLISVTLHSPAARKKYF